MNTEELLASLGWPVSENQAKGTLVWQGAMKDIDNLPPTASLVVTPKAIRAKVLNIDASKNIEPHFEAEWDISGEMPVLKKHILSGVDLIGNQSAEPATSFASLVLLVNATRPKIDIMGYRNKVSDASDQTSPKSTSKLSD